MNLHLSKHTRSLALPVLRRSLILVWGILSAGACTQQKADNRNQEPTPPSSATADSLDEALDGALDRIGAVDDIVPVPAGDSDDPELVRAATACQCLPGYKAKILLDSVTRKGVLPQLLVPAVREQVRNNQTLNTLASLPFGDFLRDTLVTDDKIATELRDGLAAKVAALTQGGSALGREFPVRLDLFSPSPQDPDAFAVEDQAVRWLLLLSQEDFFSGRGSTGRKPDQGLETLSTLRMLAEWNYLFGLEPDGRGAVFGGLTLDAGNPGSAAGPFDPRRDSASPRFFSGIWSVSFAEGSAIDLATRVSENWKNEFHSAPLSEQAALWEAAALAFGRLRPAARSGIASLFQGTGKDALPPETHTLALAFLPSLEALLADRYTDREGRSFRSHAWANDSEKSGRAPEPADSLTVARLARALHAWSLQLTNLDDSGLDAETKTKLSKVPEKLRPALQLAAYQLLQQGDAGLAPSEAAEILAVLLELESSVLGSGFLQDHIYRQSARLLAAVSGDSETQLTPLLAARLHHLAQLLARTFPQEEAALRKLIRMLEGALTAWDNSLRTGG